MDSWRPVVKATVRLVRNQQVLLCRRCMTIGCLWSPTTKMFMMRCFPSHVDGMVQNMGFLLGMCH